MQTFFYLREHPDLFWPPCIAAVALAALCAPLSVLVVLKRLAFIGQGISHAGFGGIGLAAVFGLAAADLSPMGSAAQFAVVVAFCVAAALAVGALSGGRGSGQTQPDTAIGIILVASMALGAVLLKVYAPRFNWESFLFGSLIGTGWPDAAVAAAVALVVVLSFWIIRRPLIFWAFDESGAESFGTRTGPVRLILLVLLALATVTAMKLAGVVLASALLVLPGAAATKLSDHLRPVFVASFIIAFIGVIGGLVLSFEYPKCSPGPAIVAILVTLFALSHAAYSTRRA